MTKVHSMRIVVTIIYIIAAIALIFSLAYGSVLWSAISALPFIYLIGGLFFFDDGSEDALIEKVTGNNFQKLKSTGEKIVVDFDNCEFKDSSFTNEIIDNRMRPLNFDYGKVVRNDFIIQSLLIYHYGNGNEVEKFVQPFSCAADTLKVYVLKKEITLYVDRRDRSRYFFEVNGQSQL